ncbi:MAG: hypothetical protein HKN76_04820 [Saprospiraceae bacterium]|nr:hypothetical protein [Saprospiraceae bacterium]
MKKSLLLFTIIAVTLGACSKEGIIRRKEDKLIGAWEFEKVTYKKDGALFRDNITSDYANDVIEFFPDYSAIYDDYSLRSVFDGEWSLIVDEDDVFDGSNSDLEFFVDAVFYDFLHREDFYVFGSIDRLNRNKLNLEGSDRFGRYNFKLRRL